MTAIARPARTKKAPIGEVTSPKAAARSTRAAIRAANDAKPTVLLNATGEVELEYVLRLFVSGVTPRSQRAIDNLKNICEGHLAGRYRIEVVDLYQSPGRAHDDQIIATPTLLRVLPVPTRRIIGDLSQTEKVLQGLEIT